MADGDVFQLIDKQIVGTEEILNVYHYRQTAGTGGAVELAETFRDEFLPVLLGIQTSNVFHTNIEVINLDNTADFADVALTTGNIGVEPGTPQPNFVSWTYRLVRTDRSVRNGRKSIVGVSENQTTGNVAGSGFLPTLNAVGAAMAVGLASLGGDIWELVIYGRPTPPPSSLPLRIVTVADVQYTHIGSQNSRKIY